MTDRREPPRMPWRILGAILLLALGLRLVSLARSDVIGADSYRFLAAARALEHGDWHGALADSYHPLTAILIAGANGAQTALLGAAGDFATDQRRRERAGWAISLVAGLLVVWLAIDLSARLFPDISAAAVGILAAVTPYFVRASGDIMSDMLHLACFAWALRSGVIALSGARWGPFGLAGLGVGLAYLARPEGLLLVPVLGALWLGARPWPWRTLVARALLAAAAAALLILPYAASIGWRITAKKNVTELLGIETGFAPLPVPVVLAAAGGGDSLLLDSLWTVVFEWITTAPEPVAAFAFAGLLLRARARPRDRGLILYAGIAAAMGFLLVRLLISVREPGYLSRRHVFLPVFVSLPFAVLCIEEIARRLARILPPRWGARAFPLFLALVAAIHIPKAIDAHRADQRAQRAAAERILADGGPGQRIYSTREKVAYYAGGTLVPIHASNADAAFRALAAEPRAWLAFYRERLVEWYPTLDRRLAELGGGLRRSGLWEEPNSRDGRHLELYLWEKP